MLSNMGPDRPAGRVCTFKTDYPDFCAMMPPMEIDSYWRTRCVGEAMDQGYSPSEGRLLGVRADHRHSLAAPASPPWHPQGHLHWQPAAALPTLRQHDPDHRREAARQDSVSAIADSDGSQMGRKVGDGIENKCPRGT